MLTPLDGITEVFGHLYVQLIFTWKHMDVIKK